MRGDLLSLDTVDGLVFQMCNGSYSELDAAFDFATRYKKKCKVPVHQLFEKGEPAFYDLHIPYTVSSGKNLEHKMYAVPLLLENTPSNQAKDDSKWTFTSRLFLADAVTGVPVSSGDKAGQEHSKSRPRVVRYLRKMAFRVQMINTRENPEKAGRLYPPLVALEYGEATADDLEEGKEFDFEFSVSYSMDMKEGKKDIEISVGVMSVFAVLWAAAQTWSWSRRSGRMAIDPSTLIKLVAFTCGSLAHVFLAVMFFSSFYW